MTRLRDVMRPALSIGPEESIQIAAAKMASAHVGAISVADHGRIVGLLSARDLVAKAVAQSLPAESTRVAEVMNPHPVRISDDRDVDNALLVMKARGVHELLVQDVTGRVVGIYCDCGCCDRPLKDGSSPK